MVATDPEKLHAVRVPTNVPGFHSILGFLKKRSESSKRVNLLDRVAITLVRHNYM